MKYLTFYGCFLVISMTGLYSQDLSPDRSRNWNKYLYVESGFIYPGGNIKESISIRQNISSYYVNQYSNGYISSESSGFLLGLRWEYFNLSFKTGVSAGIRFIWFSNEISGYSSNSADFFYLRYSMQETDTKFARIKSISEINNIITLPLELRVVPIQFREIELFARVGSEISILNLKKSSNIDFSEKSMEVHQDLILGTFGEHTNKVYSSLFGSVGLKYGKVNKPNYLFEVFLPSIIMTSNYFTIMDVDYFEGFKLSIQFPFNK